MQGYRQKYDDPQSQLTGVLRQFVRSGVFVPKLKQMNYVIVAVVKVAVLGVIGMLIGSCSGMQQSLFSLAA